MDQKNLLKDNFFRKYQLGDLSLPNRILMAPMTRMRCDPKTGVPNDLLVEYYSQRASAGLIFTECSPISNTGNSSLGAGGIYTQEQVEGWKRVTSKVHEKGGRIYMQIWHAGRVAHPEHTGEQNISPSAIAIRGNSRKDLPHVQPKEMTKEDIKTVLEQFRQGAINAKAAGFDGLELHGAGGYLVDSFLRDSANQRTDEYGGSVENRCRFALEVMDILIEVFGAKRVGAKFSPVGRFQDIYDSDPLKTYTYLLQELDKREVSFVHLAEPRDPPTPSHYGPGEEQIAEVARTFRPVFKGSIIMDNILSPEAAAKALDEGYVDLIGFGRYFIANPDLVERLKNGWPLNEWDFTTFYGGDAKGYTDYPLYNKQ